MGAGVRETIGISYTSGINRDREVPLTGGAARSYANASLEGKKSLPERSGSI